MSLKKELNLLHEEVLNSLPSDVSKQLILENNKLFSSFLEEKALKKGAHAPGVLFYDENLRTVYLRDLLKEHHLVLSFFRGTWCPYCSLELKSLTKIYDRIMEKDARLIAVSPELHKFSKEAIRKNNINYPVYTDLGNKAANEFGLVFNLPQRYREIYKKLSVHLNILNGENNWTLPVPATFIISKEGIITSTYINADYTKRMEPDDILEELDLLSG